MLDELTPEQRAKLARGWVWRPGHAFVQPHPKTGVCDYSNFARVSCVVDGEPMAMRGVGIGNPHPVLTDPVTADGLLRTARAMWQDESLHVVPTDTGFALCVVRPRTNGERWRYVWDGETWARPPAGRSLKVQFQSEQAALLAAILTAPEAQ